MDDDNPHEYIVTLSDGRAMPMQEYLDMIRAEYDKHDNPYGIKDPKQLAEWKAAIARRYVPPTPMEWWGDFFLIITAGVFLAFAVAALFRQHS